MSEQRKRTFGRRGEFHGLSFVVACLCLAVQVLGVTHQAVVRHTTCLEHGELVHAGEPSGPGNDAAPATGTGARLDAAALPAVSDEHDHCLACAIRKDGIAGLAVASLPPVSASAAPAPAPVGPPRSSWSLLRLAPKTSPPA